ncbi:hypothetical protein HMSSN139_46090 [Paenibacillus sp. HMSSN-139]|nr:hypothetical protein HMSSN139_46090 [Paenibacillus sp. HMSSN-139]
MQLVKNQARFDRLFEQAVRHYNNSNYESAVLWAKAAASSAWYAHPGFYVHRELEEMLQEISATLPNRVYDWSLPVNSKCSRRFLHVITQAYPTGGHSRLVERLIYKSPEGDQHSIIFLDQKGAIPSWLIDAANAKGGSHIVIPQEYSLIEKAMYLRDVAYRWADTVYLHIHPDDPIANLAFGVEGGPPVILVNHSDHSFGLGYSVSDLVFEGRVESQEVSYQKRYVRKSEFVGFPLLPAAPNLEKGECKARIGIDEDCIVMLTIAASYKFTPYESWDFPSVITKILSNHDKVVLLVIGPSPNEPIWDDAMKKANGRLQVLGVQKDLSVYYGASDIYLGSFPAGSFTSELDASLRGIPVIRPYKPLSDMLVISQYDGMNECPQNISEYLDIVSKYI